MSDVTVKPHFDFEEAIELARRELQKTHSTPFSEQAFRRLEEQIGSYAVELIIESVKRAKRHQAEGVSSADVQQASQYLVSNPSHKIFRHAGTLGGLLFGAALSHIVATTSTQYRIPGSSLLSFSHS
jgi:histone H3/H4